MAPIDASEEVLVSQNLSEISDPKPIAETKVESDLPLLLIVEDNADVREYLIALLENHYQLLIATDGQQGIDQAIENVPDLILSDVMMPVKDGFELCDTLKNDERTSHIPIILLTAKADFESKMSGLEKGADVYLSKPFEPKELFVRLKHLLELRKKLQARYASFSVAPAISEKPLSIEDAFLQKIRTLLEKDLSDVDFGMPQLCQGLGMSRSQIYKKVKALTGHSPSQHVRSIRLHHAQNLLKTSDLNVSEVAYEVGFSSPSYFSDVFLEEFGVRPNETRK